MELTNKIRRVYLPMTETGFYILFSLQKENHGYGITQKVKEMTDSQVSISPGTMYGTLSKMEKDGLISFRSKGIQSVQILVSQEDGHDLFFCHANIGFLEFGDRLC